MGVCNPYPYAAWYEARAPDLFAPVLFVVAVLFEKEKDARCCIAHTSLTR